MTTFLEKLAIAEAQNNSMLCVGLDPDPAKFPSSWKNDLNNIFDFCAAIVDATLDLSIAFKPQVAYFAANRAEDKLELLIRYIRDRAPEVPIILDAKRGDIGSTAEQYAREAFERYGADAVTLSPFMGFDSIEPYLKYPEKGLFLLCRTSNPGGDFLQGETLQGRDLDGNRLRVYEYIAKTTSDVWNQKSGQLGLVVGATYPGELAIVRKLAPTLPLLIPGVGAQGGDVIATVKAAWRPDAPIVVNSSRAILYASSGKDFQDAARCVAMKTRDELEAAKTK